MDLSREDADLSIPFAAVRETPVLVASFELVLNAREAIMDAECTCLIIVLHYEENLNRAESFNRCTVPSVYQDVATHSE